MSAGREELHRILKAVIHDLELDGYAREQIASAMAARGIQILFGAPMDALQALDMARRVVLEQDEELLQ
jgi:hypothetical protein